MPVFNLQCGLVGEKRIATACVVSVAASLLLFAASMSQVGYCFDGGTGDRGFWLVVFGWLGLERNACLARESRCFRIASSPWAFRPRRFAFVFAALLLGFALSFLERNGPPGDQRLAPGDQAGYGLGYWLWIASIGTLLVGAGVAAMLEKLADRAANLETPEDWRPDESIVDLTKGPNR